MSAGATAAHARADVVRAALDGARDELVRLSREIHAHPELNFEERHAATALSAALERWGFAVERGVGGVETAFRATATGSGPGPTVAFLAEYDALPGIGHGCGHNLIAMSAVGAGVGAKAARGGLPGRIQVIGTPAEEGGGGKLRLLEAGVFADVDVALSSHPGSHLTLIPTKVEPGTSWSLAMIGFRYAFHGRSAHAAMNPQDGINALNGVLRLFSGIDTLRQWEIPFFGAALLTDSTILVPDDFSAGEDCFRYSEHADLGRIASQRLLDANLQRVAEAGQKRLLARHTNTRRAEYFLNIVEKYAL